MRCVSTPDIGRNTLPYLLHNRRRCLMKLTLAFSPCPNNTFMFHGIAEGRLTLPGCDIEVHLHDIETLNQLALDGVYDITKVSFHALMLANEKYRLLNAGAALGFGCGPLVVAAQAMTGDEVASGRVAVPGEHTTANLLFSLWAPEARDKVFVGYERIMDMVASGETASGVIIHEGRFVFQNSGLHRVVDLGAWWEEQTGLPIPLGGIAIRKTVPEKIAVNFEELLKKSILDSRSGSVETLPFIKEHAQEMDEEVLAKHIETFVNEYSLDLGPEGAAAVTKLEEMARKAGVFE